MTTINRAPEGLLGFLDLKQLGVNPQSLGQSVAPTLDLEKYYSADLINVVRANQAYGAVVGNFAQLTIPSGECWMVYGIEAHVLVAGAGTITICPLIGMSQGFYAAEAMPFGQVLGVNDISVCTRMFPTPIVFPPGTDFFCSILDNTSTGTAFTDVLRVRLPI